MRNFKFILVILVAFLILPFGVLAEETTTGETTESNEVNLYFFHGNGCPHCEDAAEWFEEIEAEYGQYFNLVSYEVWYDEDNSNLMNAVADARKETADGVPYIIIGNQSWSGFADDYKEDMLAKIKSEYGQDVTERYDVMDFVDLEGNLTEEEESTTGRDVLILLVLVGVVAAVTVGVIVARKKTN